MTLGLVIAPSSQEHQRRVNGLIRGRGVLLDLQGLRFLPDRQSSSLTRPRPAWLRSMAGMDGPSELDLAQGQRERHGRKRNQHQHPERIHVAKERRLCLHLRADPLDRLIVRLRQ